MVKHLDHHPPAVLSRAACAWASDAVPRGSSSKSANKLDREPSSSRSMLDWMMSNGTGSARSLSLPRIRETSGGRFRPSVARASDWPTFIAAPLRAPMVSTTRSAFSRCSLCRASRRVSESWNTPLMRWPRYEPDTRDVRPPRRAIRPKREDGGLVAMRPSSIPHAIGLRGVGPESHPGQVDATCSRAVANTETISSISASVDVNAGRNRTAVGPAGHTTLRASASDR